MAYLAYEKLIQDQTGNNAPKKIVGPKTLNVYGAPYVWAVFMGIGLIEEALYIQEKIDISVPEPEDGNSI